MFGKPLSALTPDDIDRVWKEELRESDVVEFKEALSAKNGRDGWHDGANKIGDVARDKIINEVIAFANAHGGTLILGIEETDDKPPRAKRVSPIPRCADLAGRLALMLRDLIEPPLAPFPAVVPVVMDGNAGVVALQVTASRNAPHRHSSNLESYVRRGEHTQRMTMREMQDLTLQVERGLSAIERRFQERADAAERWTREAALVLKATAMPLTPMEVAGIPGNAAAYPMLQRFSGTFEGGAKAIAQFSAELGSWRPILRGVRSEGDSTNRGYRIELLRDGLVEYVFALTGFEKLQIFPTWFVGLACNSLLAIERARYASGSPTTEYGLELAVWVRKRALRVGSWADYSYGSWGPIEPPGYTLPRYSVGDRGAFQSLLDIIQRDFWNAAGVNAGDEELLKVELVPHLPQ
jgi:hypothetical protein